MLARAADAAADDAAALLGRVLGDAISEQTGGDYGSRVTVYGLLLLYVVAGAVVSSVDYRFGPE